jgi:hypothetical protein
MKKAPYVVYSLNEGYKILYLQQKIYTLPSSLSSIFFKFFYFLIFASCRGLIYQAHLFYREYKIVGLMNQIPKGWVDESNSCNKNMIYLL